MKWLLYGSFILSCGFVPLFGATIEPGDSSKRHKTDYVTNWTAKDTQTYTVSASASGCSFVDSKTKANGGATLKSHSSSSASAEKDIVHTDKPTTSGFGFSVSGVLAGTGDGGEVTWSATLQQRFFWLEASPSNIVKAGTAVTVTAKGDPTESTWTINNTAWKNGSANPVKTSSVILNRNMWDKMGWTPNPVPTGYLFPPAGTYSVAATTTETENARSADITIKITGIKELSTSVGSRTIKSVTDSPGEDESVLIDAPNTNPNITAGTLTLIATPDPGPDWPTDYPKWKVNGTSVQTGGGAYAFSAAGRSAGKYTVAAECGNIVAIDVYVTRCQAIIRVHEPSAGSGVPIDYFSYANFTYSVGHATAEVAIFPKEAAKIKPLSTTYANMQVGISSANKRDLIIHGISDGAFHAPDSLSAVTATDLTVVDIASAQKGIALIEQYVKRSPSYVLANYLHYDSLPPYSSTQAVCSNCATIAKRIASTTGLTVPSAYHNWQGTVGGIRTFFQGDSPGFLGPRL